jgi:hypothetical protein
VQNIIQLGNKRAYIHHKTFDIYGIYEPKIITVNTNHHQYSGSLLYVDNNELILDVGEDNKNNKYDTLTISSNEINHVLIPGNSNIGVGAGVGFLSGFALGFIVGYADGDDPAEKWLFSMSAGEKGLTAGLALGLGGLILGTIIGLASSSWDEDIVINSEYDFNELKKYSKYPALPPGHSRQY